MKLTVIGGAGVRAPLLMPALARRQDVIDLREVVLLDTDEARLSLMGPLAAHSAHRSGADFDLRWTSDARNALQDAGAVVTTIRVGGEQGRARDERIALEHGVLGQETTGACGFAMALRTIPVVLDYARKMRDYCPDAWLMNFTNPAGLVTQAVVDEIPELKVAGICDTPSSMRRDISAAFGRASRDVPVSIFGLNHLSWMSEAWVDGVNVVPRLLEEPELMARVPDLAFFEPDLVRLLGLVPNEYLYYYYYRDRALENIRAAGESRGEQVARLSAGLMHDLQEINPTTNAPDAWDRYRAYLAERGGSYMAMETSRPKRDREASSRPSGDEGEGYAGVALDILVASRGEPATVVVNVPNREALPGMDDGDVVEVSCRCDTAGLTPIPMDSVPADELLLMQQVKRFERLTVEAIRHRSRERAVEALLVHPLVASYPVATSLVDAFLTAHRDSLGDWN